MPDLAAWAGLFLGGVVWWAWLQLYLFVQSAVTDSEGEQNL